jgi:putative membrane protein
MKKNKIALLVVSTLCMLPFASSTFAAANMQANTMNQAHDAMMMQKENTKEAEILAFVAAIDNYEINAAKMAQGKNVDANVMNYAKLLQDDHEKNLSDNQNLVSSLNLQPENFKEVTSFIDKGNKQLQELEKITDTKKFEKAYVNVMIKGHEEALNKINKFLKEEAKNTNLKNYLTDTKNTVEKHLQAGKQLQSEMKKEH